MIAKAIVGDWLFTCRKRGCMTLRVVDLAAVVRSAREFIEAEDAAWAVAAGEGWTRAGRSALCPEHRRPVSLVKRAPAVVVPLPVKNMPRPGGQTAAAPPTGGVHTGPRQPIKKETDDAAATASGVAQAPGQARPPAVPPARRAAAGTQPAPLREHPIGGTVRDGIAGMLPAAASRRHGWSLFPRRNSGTGALAHTLRTGAARHADLPPPRQTAGRPARTGDLAEGSGRTAAAVPGRAISPPARPGTLTRLIRDVAAWRWWPWRRRKGKHAAEFESHPATIGTLPGHRRSA